MIESRKYALPVLTIIMTVVITLVVYLTVFAAQGRRYTADDGDRDRKCSLERDALLGRRIDALEIQIEALGSYHPKEHE